MREQHVAHVFEQVVARALPRRGFDLRLRQRRKLRLQPLPRFDDAIAERGFVGGVAHGDGFELLALAERDATCPAWRRSSSEGKTTPA